jgi:hypothetical protein
MKSLVGLSVAFGLLAASVSYIFAYDRARLTGSRRQARRLALNATPGPFLFYLVLGLVVSFAVPYFIER